MSNKVDKRIATYCRRAREAELECSALRNDLNEMRLLLGRSERVILRYQRELAKRKEQVNV